MTDKKKGFFERGFVETIKSEYNKEKNKKTKLRDYVILIVFVLVAVAMCSGPDSDEPPVVKTKDQIENDIIEKQFSAWDGSHTKLYLLVKNNLKDPDSLEHINTRYIKHRDKDGNFNNIITVNMSYRAKNSFGGYVVEQISADYDVNGNLIKINNSN